MDVLQKIVQIVNQAEKKSKTLSLEETIDVFNAVKHISSNKALVEKVIYLVFLTKSKEGNLLKLSKRENEVFTLIGMGLDSNDIAIELNISKSTVSTHRKNIIKKLNIKGAGQLQKLSFQYIQHKVFA
ncbi:helix-turn-helix transcriptional regulator [Ulvibacter litoralis]|uniref:Regulatory protein, luxR family n=1 Tax=Ulvibacter litoralis TaxID=227084 RepID=A0A1G7GQR8_9FLAO|nr:helix-turn-helix transcriptional regulator [Ulvibacter litoralis]GHC55386.1 hypothetical protein GCM10008083_19390 [Ulvibacter litoralis]SDE90518.1 regulatory protein, luxR family [Ulvibacter litoralis]